MANPIPGDIVRRDDDERVVVDVTDDGLAVLRHRDDLDLQDPTVAEASTLEVVGHLDSLEGWTEHSPGVWEKDES